MNEKFTQSTSNDWKYGLTKYVRSKITILPNILLLFCFYPEMSSACYVYFIYTNALSTNFITEANTMNPDQTAPLGAVWSGFIVFAI